jgi:hypothetical protein
MRNSEGDSRDGDQGRRNPRNQSSPTGAGCGSVACGRWLIMRQGDADYGNGIGIYFPNLAAESVTITGQSLNPFGTFFTESFS